MKRALVTFAFLSCACFNNPTDVGSPCSTTADCDPAHICDTNDAGGFCTKGCTFEGELRECPSGSICTYPGGTRMSCAPICKTEASCRSGYECAPVNNSMLLGCRLKTN